MECPLYRNVVQGYLAMHTANCIIDNDICCSYTVCMHVHSCIAMYVYSIELTTT